MCQRECALTCRFGPRHDPLANLNVDVAHHVLLLVGVGVAMFVGVFCVVGPARACSPGALVALARCLELRGAVVAAFMRLWRFSVQS